MNDLRTPLAEGVWLDRAPVSILGMRLTATMAVMRLRGDGLLLYSPVEMTEERRALVEALGEVRHLYAPNTFHHLWMGAWAQAFPDARVHAPAELAKKRPDLRIDRTHESGPEPDFAGVLDEVRVDGFRLREGVLLHRASRTLLVADLVHNIGANHSGWTKFYSRAMGFYDRVALSRVIKWTAFDDRTAARKSVDTILALPFDRVVVGHGDPIVDRPREQLTAALEWLGG